jgi:hypothetical protein
MPVALPIVAVPVALLLHVPPLVPLLSVIVNEGHTTLLPVIPAGSGFTVIVVVVRQPVGNV